MSELPSKIIDVVIPVYDGLPLVADTVAALLEQALPPEYILSIIVVDDGSTDGTVSHLENSFAGKIKIVSLQENSGRAAACNMGANAGAGEVIMFLDSDCVPGNNRLLFEHIQTVEDGAMISCGLIRSSGQGFWAEYQRHLAEIRVKQLESHDAALTFTSANMVVKRSCFEEVGMFNEEYGHYGFEDRDLLLRLQENGGSLCYTPLAIVNHDDDATLESICKKMEVSGQHSARIFSSQHISSYKSMSYYQFDARYHWWLRLICPIIFMLVPMLLRSINAILEVGVIPFKIRCTFVRIISALSYLKGTCKQY